MKSFRIQYQTADGIKMFARLPRLNREIYRMTMRILRLNGSDRTEDQIALCEKRKYVLWTQLPNGTFVYREDY